MVQPSEDTIICRNRRAQSYEAAVVTETTHHCHHITSVVLGNNTSLLI